MKKNKILIVNKYKFQGTAIIDIYGKHANFYIGRGSSLGNIYTHLPLDKTKAEFQCATRKESVQKYEVYILNEIKKGNILITNELNKILDKYKEQDVRLICYCAPLLCHGDIIKKLIKEKLEKNERF